MMIRLSLPYPPSANKLWRTFQGRQIKSAEYRRWLSNAQATVSDACIGGSMPGEYVLEIVATRPDGRGRDIDNLIKPISDAIAAAGLVTNDSLAAGVSAFWSRSAPVKGGAVEVTLRTA